MGAPDLISNGNFEETVASGWTTNLAGIGGVSSAEKFKGLYSYRLQGDPKTERYATKSFSVSGNSQSFVLSCFAKAASLPIVDPDGTRKFRLGGQICYTDGTTEEMRYADYNPYITDWQVAGIGLGKSLANWYKTIDD